MNQILLTVITILVASIGYFIKRILDSTDAIRDDVSEIKPKVNILWSRNFASSNSPLTLNEAGNKILQESGIKAIIDKSLYQMLEEIKIMNPKNAYEIQEYSKIVTSKLKNNSDVLPSLQTGAYNTGVDVDAVLFVGAMYLRDIALPKFNCKLSEIDKK